MFGFLKKAVSGLVDGIRKKVEEEEEPEKPSLPETKTPAKTIEIEAPKPAEKIPEAEENGQQPTEPEKIREPEKKHVAEPVQAPPPPEKEIGGFENREAGGPSTTIAGKLLGRIRGAAGAVKKKIEEREIKDGDVEGFLWNFQLTLVQANIAQEVAEKLCSDVRKNLVGRKIKRGEEVGTLVRNILRESVLEILEVDKLDLAKAVRESDKPAVIVFLGVNGVGKTLCIAKVARYLAKMKISSVMAAGDTFRAGSIQQLEVHGSKLGVKVVKHDYGSDAAAVCFDAIGSAKAHGMDAVLVDTAGRLQSNKALMEELKKIVRVAKPRLKIFVGDSLTGSDLVAQCETFNREIGIDGIILTKSDVDEKGGAAISAAYVSKKPILFLGTGQEYDDLVPFEPEKFVDSLFMP